FTNHPKYSYKSFASFTSPFQRVNAKSNYHNGSKYFRERAGAVLGHVLSLPFSNGNRKRTRLDYLTEEEKALRRKLLNREAAQKARDRKKDSIRLMEQSIRSLQSENQSLRQTIGFLKHKCQEQETRLNSMHYQLGLLTKGDKVGKSEQIEPSEPAVLSPPQQGLVLCVILLVCLSFVNLVLASFSRPTLMIVVSFSRMTSLPISPRKLRFHRSLRKTLPAR
ncbi:unnamed protein product, partial [Taenia asiatica]|uniref:X-box-binding protein 1 n=1 Tax=Taenia asiatica TaxID=60517 RepID=A0A0R3VVB8_TAEAS